MKIVTLFAVQFLITMLLVTTSVSSSSASTVRKTIKQVLGAKYLVQDVPVTEENPVQEPSQSSDNASSDNSPSTSQNPQDQTSAIPGTTPSKDLQDMQLETGQSSYQEPKTEETSFIKGETPVPEQSAQITPLPNKSITFSQNSTNQLNTEEFSNSTEEGNNSELVNQAVVNAESVLTSPETINKNTIDKQKEEDKQIEAVQDLQKQTEILLGFAREKIIDTNKTISINDFSTTSFMIQRFTAQVTKANENLQKVDFSKKQELSRQLKKFCKQADLGLRTQSLLVPQEFEQDIEIGRGVCLQIK